MALTIFAFIFIVGCAAQNLRMTADVQQGQRLFEAGYYKRAMKQLLPAACEHNRVAEYAVGYMYYYGYGTPQDTDMGYFWIERSANQHYLPAIKALNIMTKQTKIDPQKIIK